jgi:hypothetical protein
METILRSANGTSDVETAESVRAGLASLRALVDGVTHFVDSDETEQRVFPYLAEFRKTSGLEACAELLPKPPLAKWLEDEDKLLKQQESQLDHSIAQLETGAEHTDLVTLRNAIKARKLSIDACVKLGTATLHSAAPVDCRAADHINCGRLRHLAQEHAEVLRNSMNELEKTPPAEQALAALYRAARCRQAIRVLVEEDDLQIRRINGWLQWYGLGVAGFAIMLTLVAATVSYANHFDLVAASMAQTPILIVPMAVLIWSFLGAVCATLYHFNIYPSSELSNFVKWLVTRPIVGLVFGAVTYFVLDSGLMAIRGNTDSINSSAAVIVLCFLAAFSDRFALVVFKALIPSELTPRMHDDQRDRLNAPAAKPKAGATSD